jgi:hypothetical protein
LATSQNKWLMTSTTNCGRGHQLFFTVLTAQEGIFMTDKPTGKHPKSVPYMFVNQKVGQALT